MKYILLIGTFLFGIVGISQAMDVYMGTGVEQIINPFTVINFKYFLFSFPSIPEFIKIILLSMGFFMLFLILQKLKALGLRKIWEYTPS